jgi:hypothetical protein
MLHSFSQKGMIGAGGAFGVRRFIAALSKDLLAASRQLAAAFERTNDCDHGICGHPGGKPPCVAAVRVMKAAMNRRTPNALSHHALIR